MATAKQHAQWKKWQAAGAAKKRRGGARARVRRKRALVHGYSKLVVKARKATGPLKLKIKLAKAKLWDKMAQ